MSVRERNAMVGRLKEELLAALAVVAHARESLTNEMETEWAQKKLSVDDKFLRKLKEMTSAFNSLTEAKIRLDKAEMQLEKDMTPEEEHIVVLDYCASMTVPEWREFSEAVKIRQRQVGTRVSHHPLKGEVSVRDRSEDDE